MFVWLFFCTMYYFFFFYPIIKFGNIPLFAKNWKKLALVLIPMFIIIGEIIYFFIINEHFIYYWDYGGYYTWSLSVKEIYQNNHLGIFKIVYESSVYNDYGMFIPSLVAYPLSFTQGRYVDYIVLLYVMFGIPFSLSLSMLVSKIAESNSPVQFCVCTVCSLIMPGSFYAMLLGYPGIASFIPILCSLWILFSNGMKNLKITDALVLSFSLIFSFVLRRYFSFYVLAFVVASIGYCFSEIALYHEKGTILKTVGIYCKNYLIVGAISLVVILCFFFGLVKRVFFTDYSAMYVAYKHGNLLENYKHLFNQYGWGIFYFCLLISVFILIRKRKFIPHLVFVALFEIIATLSFFHTQSPGAHHYWVFYLPVLFLLLLFFQFSDEKIVIKKGINVVKLFLFLFLIGNSIYVFSGRFFPKWETHFFSRQRYYIRQRGDIQELQQLGNYLENLAKNKKVYVTASSGILNTDILLKMYLPKLNAPFTLAWQVNVDQYDGFSLDFLNSEIVVATDGKSETHLGEQNQRCVTVLNENVQNPNTPIGENFTRGRSFNLDSGVVATVYIRKSDWSKSAVDYLESIYDGYYPDKPELFHNRFEDYKTVHFDGIDSVLENSSDIDEAIK